MGKNTLLLGSAHSTCYAVTVTPAEVRSATNIAKLLQVVITLSKASLAWSISARSVLLPAYSPCRGMDASPVIHTYEVVK